MSDQKAVSTPGNNEKKDRFSAAANWWASVLVNPKFDALGGERDAAMEIAQVLLTVSHQAPDRSTLDRFAGILAEDLRNLPEFHGGYVGVDYHPDETLSRAARKAGLTDNGSLFPIKTSMWIRDDYVAVRYGYGAKEQRIWEASK